MKKKNLLGFVLAAAIVIGAFGACRPEPPQVTPPPAAPAPATPAAPAPTPTPPPPPPEVTIERGLIMATQSETPSIAPARHTSLVGHFKNVMVSNGLFRLDYNVVPTPDTIESWRALSDTEFEFIIRPGIMFHNGEELTAHDFVASFAYARTYPYAITVHGSIAHAEAIDDYTLIIDTGEPNALLIFDLAHHGNFAMPRSLIESGWDFTAHPIGTGPFKFDHWNFGDSLHFVRNDYYFDTTRAPHLPYVTWRIIPEGSSRTVALETGEIDYIVEVPFPDVPRLRENPNITVYERPGLTARSMNMNNERFPFTNIHVRHALDMALDKEGIVLASLDGFGVANWRSTPPIFAGSSTENIRSFDPDGARALLAEHGIDPASIGFEISVTTEEQRRAAEVAQANFADIGIPTTITMMDFATQLAHSQAGELEASMGAFTPGNIMAFMRGTMHTTSIGAQNGSRVSNPELDALIDLAIATADPVERTAILYQASALSNYHLGTIPLSMNILVRAFSSSLISPEIGPNGFMFLNMVYWAE